MLGFILQVIVSGVIKNHACIHSKRTHLKANKICLIKKAPKGLYYGSNANQRLEPGAGQRERELNLPRMTVTRQPLVDCQICITDELKIK